jgi:hypothetical protein
MAGTSISGALRLKIRDALRPATRNGAVGGPFFRARNRPKLGGLGCPPLARDRRMMQRCRNEIEDATAWDCLVRWADFVQHNGP